MPLNEAQTAALQTAADALQGADAKDVAEALRETLPDAHQHVYRIAFGKAKGEGNTKAGELQAQIDALTAERDEAKAEADRLSAAQPDFAAELQRRTDALTAEKQKREQTEATGAERLKKLHTRRAVSEAVAALIEKGVDADYAREVLAPKLEKRAQVASLTDDGDAEVAWLDSDGLTPLTSGLPGLVTQTLTALDPKWIRSNADGGAGSGGGSGRGGDRGPITPQKIADDKRGTSEYTL